MNALRFASIAFTAIFALAVVAPCAMAIETATTYGNEIKEESMTIQPASEHFSIANASGCFNQVSIKQIMTDGNTSYKLFPTFDNPDQALRQITSDAPNMLSHLQDKYNFEPINSENWQDYQDAMSLEFDSEDCPTWFFEEEDEYTELLRFFDIYENDEANEEIRVALAENEIASMANRLNKTNASAFQEVLEMLPDQEVLNEESYDVEVDVSSTLSSNVSSNKAVASAKNQVNEFDIDKGVTYAKNHATNPNQDAYGYIGTADCTNFTSQILEKGGVAQKKYTSVYKGWWHKKIVADTVVHHSRSRSWTVADTFATYMGVGYKTKSNASFSSHIKKGDFIAADWSSDGQ